jgi:hypothetical protein
MPTALAKELEARGSRTALVEMRIGETWAL